MFTRLTEKLDSFIEMGIPGYDCVVYHKGKCVYRHMNGYSDYENKIPVNGKEFYNIYSCSKVITCTAALMLFEKGLFKLEDKLSKYMPEFKNMMVSCSDGTARPAKCEITILDLFRMTAGFDYRLSSDGILRCREETGGRCPTRELMKYLATEPLCFDPGERYQYSLCHDVIAALVEVISGKRFGEFVRENIFVPCGMDNSTFLLDDSEIDKLCEQYRYDNDAKKLVNVGKSLCYKLGSEYESGGAGCISTVDDYIKFLEALRTGKLLGADTIKLMTTPKLTDAQFPSYGDTNYSYGLGVRCPYAEGISDFGWGGAAGAFLAVDMENEYTVYYAQHVLNTPNNMYRREIAFILHDIFTGK